jgi:hypothetical protein
MKAFYSILNTSIRPIAKEQLSIGLFMSDSVRSYFHYSHEKLYLTRKLLSNNSFNLLKGYLEGLREDIYKKSPEEGLSGVSPDYFNYLSVYNNNLITFSKPTPINIELSQDNFEKLFEKFVFNYEKYLVVEHQVKKSSLDLMRKELYPKIERHVNLNRTFTPKEIPSLIIPKVKVNFIGRNDKPVAGETINFEVGSNALSNQLSHFISLIKAFELEKEKGKYYVIGDEPSKTQFPEQHSTWKHLVSSKLVDFVPVNEVEKISNYISRHKVRPFIQE